MVPASRALAVDTACSVPQRAPEVRFTTAWYDILPADSAQTRCRKTALKWFPAQVQEVRIWALPFAYASSTRSIVVPPFDSAEGLFHYLRLVARFGLGHFDGRKSVAVWQQIAEANEWALEKMREAGIPTEGISSRRSGEASLCGAGTPRIA